MSFSSKARAKVATPLQSLKGDNVKPPASGSSKSPSKVLPPYVAFYSIALSRIEIESLFIEQWSLMTPQFIWKMWRCVVLCKFAFYIHIL